MSQYTREEILKMIEEEGPEKLDLSGKDLSGIDLGRQAVARELMKYQQEDSDKTPLWFSEETGGVNLQGATFKEANFLGAKVDGANFERAHLEEAVLHEAHLEEARLVGAYLQQASLPGSYLKGADLESAHLESAYLWWAHLEGAYLLSAELGGADLRGANLEAAMLWWAHLEKVDLSVAASLAGAYFYGAWLDQTRMTKEQLGGRIGEEIGKEYYQAKEAYLLLKNNFNQIGRYDDASWAYIKERQMEKMTYHPKLARMHYAKTEALPAEASPKSWAWWRFYVKYTLKWDWDWIIEGLCGYGEKPGRVLRAMLLLLVIAPFGYRLFGGLTHADGRVAGPLDYLVYSFDAFTRIVGTDLVPLTMWGHLVTGFEAFLAILLASLFIYTLGRRMSHS